MKAVFLVNATPNVEMFVPIMKELPHNWESLVINLDRWAKRAEIEQKLQEFGVNYMTIGGWSRREVDKVLQEVQPSVVIMPHDTAIPPDRLFISCADSKHIPTLYVLHGMLSPGASPRATRRGHPYGPGIRSWIRYLSMLLLGAFRLVQLDSLSRRRLIETGWLWIKHALRYKPEGHGGCSKIAVFGDATKELFVSEGISPERIVVTGSPKFDQLFYTKGSDCKSKVCRRYGIPEDKDIILLLTGYFVEFGLWTPGQREQFVMAIYQAISKLPQTKLIIKLHPAVEKEADYQEIIKDLPEPPVICQDVLLWELLHACRMAITVNSTTGLEAMAVGKPLMIVNFWGDAEPFDETSGAIVVRKEDDLLPALETILYNGLSEEMKEKASNFVRRYAYAQDGKAAKRIADLIVQMATETKDRSTS
jgi:hypothetical protein